MENKTNEKGAVTLVEAVIVFPIVFFVLVIIIYIGNMYYVRAYMQDVADKYSLVAAEYTKNYTTLLIDENHGDYSLQNHNINPYQQIFGISSDIDGKLETKVKNKATGSANTLIGIMAPRNITGGLGSKGYVDINDGFFSSEVKVAISYRMNLILGFWFIDALPSVEFRVESRSSVCDDAEFIKNIDYIEDLYIDVVEETGLGDKLREKFDKFVGVIKKFLDMFK